MITESPGGGSVKTRAVVGAVLVAVLVALVLAHPGVLVALVVLAIVLGALPVVLVTRAARHVARRPPSSLSVTDALVGTVALAWWRRRSARRAAERGARAHRGAKASRDPTTASGSGWTYIPPPGPGGGGPQASSPNS